MVRRGLGRAEVKLGWPGYRFQRGARRDKRKRKEDKRKRKENKRRKGL